MEETLTVRMSGSRYRDELDYCPKHQEIMTHRAYVPNENLDCFKLIPLRGCFLSVSLLFLELVEQTCWSLRFYSTRSISKNTLNVYQLDLHKEVNIYLMLVF